MDIQTCRAITEKALRGQEAAMLALLKELVDIDSPTDCAEGVRRVGQVCADWLARAGFATACLPHAPVPEDEAWQAELASAWTARHGAAGAGPGLPESGQRVRESIPRLRSRAWAEARSRL